jgi:site-specific recombinase XerD
MEQATITTLEQIEQKQITAFFSYLAQRRHDRKSSPLSAAYIAKYLHSIKNFNTFLKLTGKWAFTLPKRSIQVVAPKKAILLPEEVLVLYVGCDTTLLGIRDRAMLSLCYGLGLRRSEGIGLDIDDLLFSKNLVYIRKEKTTKNDMSPICTYHNGSTALPEQVQTASTAESTCSSQSVQQALLISSQGRSAMLADLPNLSFILPKLNLVDSRFYIRSLCFSTKLLKLVK